MIKRHPHSERHSARPLACAPPRHGRRLQGFVPAGGLEENFRRQDTRHKKSEKEYVPAFEKAAAVVTEEGGLTSHAGVISLDRGIPCITGRGGHHGQDRRRNDPHDRRGPRRRLRRKATDGADRRAHVPSRAGSTRRSNARTRSAASRCRYSRAASGSGRRARSLCRRRRAFTRAWERSNVKAVVSHASYLINHSLARRGGAR